MNKSFIKPVILISAILLGIFLPQAHILAFTVPWFIRFMLFMVFLQVNYRHFKVQRSHWGVLGANLAIALIFWQLFKRLGDPELGETAFFVGITPTATAASVVTGFLGRKVEYVATSLLLTTLGISGALIYLLPLVIGRQTPEVFCDVALRVGGVILVPLILALIIRRFYPSAKEKAAKFKMIVYLAWACVLTIIIGGASDFIRSHREITSIRLTEAALISLFLCVVNFVTGYWIAESENRREGSQSLGQKNTSITIYLAMTYANPFVALGPTFYVIWHNLWNTYQLAQYARREGEETVKKSVERD